MIRPGFSIPRQGSFLGIALFTSELDSFVDTAFTIIERAT